MGLQELVDALETAHQVIRELREQAYEHLERRRAAEYRAERLAEALRSVCTELRLERGCYEGECGTHACCYSDCVIGPALKLLDSLEREVRRGE